MAGPLVLALALAAAGARRTRSWSARSATPPASTRTGPPTWSPPRSWRTCASRWCAIRAGRLAPRGRPGDGLGQRRPARLDASRCARACASTTARRSTPTRWSANLEHLRSERALPRPRRAAGPARGRDRRWTGPTRPCWPRCRSPSSRCRARASWSRARSARSGTGPFRLERPGRASVELAADPEHWAGAPRLRQLAVPPLPRPRTALAARARRRARWTSPPSLGREQRSTALRAGPEVLARLADRPQHRLPVREQRARRLLGRRACGWPWPAPSTARPWCASCSAATASRRATRCRRPSGATPTRTRGAAAGPRRRPAPAGRRASRGGLRDRRSRSRGAPRPYLPEPLRAGRAHPRRPGAGRASRCGCATSSAGPSTWRGPRAATTSWRCWAGRPTPLDPNDFLSALLDSDSIGTTNRSRYRSAAMDALLKRAAARAGPEERSAATGEAQDLFQKDMPLGAALPRRPSSPPTGARCAGWWSAPPAC